VVVLDGEGVSLILSFADQIHRDELNDEVHRNIQLCEEEEVQEV